MLLYIHRDHKDYKGRGAQDGHLDFHAALNSESLSFTPTETIRTIRSGEPRTHRLGLLKYIRDEDLQM